MGLDDKIQNKAEDVRGRAKESAGAATNDDELRAEGQADQASAGAKDKVEKAKDRVKDAIDKI